MSGGDERSGAIDPLLGALVESWSSLPAHVRAAIETLLEATRGGARCCWSCCACCGSVTDSGRAIAVHAIAPNRGVARGRPFDRRPLLGSRARTNWPASFRVEARAGGRARFRSWPYALECADFRSQACSRARMVWGGGRSARPASLRPFQLNPDGRRRCVEFTPSLVSADPDKADSPLRNPE